MIDQVDAKIKLLVKKGEKQNAVVYLQKRKLYEKEQTKLSGMQLKLQEQLFGIESETASLETLETLTMASEANRQSIKESEKIYENFEELKDQISEQQAAKEQRDSIFTDLIDDEADQLAAELEKLELADKAEQEAITRDQMQAEDAQKLDDELAAWEEKIKGLEQKQAEEDPYRLQEQEEEKPDQLLEYAQ